jgi:soluble lytic murein transglycosylase-like protein
MFDNFMSDARILIYSLLLERLVSQLSGSNNGHYQPKAATTSNVSPGAQSFQTLVDAAGERYKVDPALINAVIQAESGFRPDAVSSAGAKGLMQLMDGTARGLGVQDSLDPAQNIDGGVRFLRSLLDRFESVPLALAGYNAGPGAVDRYGGVPPYAETQTYVKRVMQLYQQNKEWEA